MSASRRGQADPGPALPRAEVSRTLSRPPVMLAASMELAVPVMAGAAVAVLAAVFGLGLPTMTMLAVVPAHLWSIAATSREPHTWQLMLAWTRIPRHAGRNPRRWRPAGPGTRRRLSP